MRITEAEVLDALAAAAAHTTPEDARTVEEMATEIGVAHCTIQRALKVFQRAGRLQVHHRRNVRLDGRPCLTPAYTIKPAPKRKR